MKQKPTNNVLAFLSLEDFAEEVIPLDNLVRVESVTTLSPFVDSLIRRFTDLLSRGLAKMAGVWYN